MKTLLKGPDITVEMDTEEIYPNDPGMGTPVLIELDNGDTGTWNYVTSEGETADGTQLTEEQKEWLNSITPTVEQWMKKNHV